MSDTEQVKIAENLGWKGDFTKEILNLRSQLSVHPEATLLDRLQTNYENHDGERPSGGETLILATVICHIQRDEHGLGGEAVAAQNYFINMRNLDADNYLHEIGNWSYPDQRQTWWNTACYFLDDLDECYPVGDNMIQDIKSVPTSIYTQKQGFYFLFLFQLNIPMK